MSVLWEPSLDEEATKWVDVARRMNVLQFVPRAAEVDQAQEYPWDNLDLLIESGLVGLAIPKEYGGHGASLTTLVAVMAELTRGCASTGAIWGVTSLGSGSILAAGTPEQKAFYTSEILAGRNISFALTERGAGSDAANIQATGTRVEGGWHLQGEKIFIGNGGASRHYVAFVRTDPAAGPRGISAFMTSLDDEGTTVDTYADRMGLRGTQTSNVRLDTVVPEDRLVGELGKGLSIAMKTLNTGRVMIAAQALGLATAAFEQAATESVRRKTFGSPLIDYQGISFKLADVATKLSAARALTWQAAMHEEDSPLTRSLASMAKLYSSEVAHEAADVAVQVFGGDGYCKPNPVERIYRDQRITEIYEGTSEILRNSIGRLIGKSAEAGELEPLEPVRTAYGHPPFGS